MREVSAQTAALLVDALSHRGIDATLLWRELPLSPEQLQGRGERLDWELWVEMMARAERAAGGAEETERLFVKGAGARTGHVFVRLANVFLSLQGVYDLFARWGLPRTLLVMSARFEPRGMLRARFTAAIDERREGSLPTLRFVSGILRHLPGLQGLDDAVVRLEPGATPHRAVYALTLPKERSFLSRARRVVQVARGSAAALDELEQQAAVITAQNAELVGQLDQLRSIATSLRERETWLALALEAGHVGIWQWDLARQRVRLSPGLAGLLGTTDLEIDAASWTARIHPDDRERTRATMERSLGQREPFEAEYRIARPDESLAWVLVKGQVLYGADGQATGALGTLVDVTEQKQLEMRLRFADRLISAGTLAAGVAHEVNNPLTYLMGNLDLLRWDLERQGLGPPHERALADMADGLARIRDVVRDLSAFAGREGEALGPVALPEVCAAALRIASSLVRHRATIETSYAEDTPAVLATASRLGQVVVNLVINASQAMPPNRAAAESYVRVSTARLATGEAALRVEDNGVGVPQDALPRLFDPFFTTKEIGEGSGLGLSVCQGIVAGLGGRIDVESHVGAGTTFTVVLPAAPGAPAVESAAERAHPARQARILVVDDEPLVRRALCNVLLERGFVVEDAASGNEALAVLEARPESFDVVLCDLMMPDGSGADLHAAIEARWPELLARTVFVSGGAVTERARAFARRPDVVLLQKPIEMDRLLAAVTRVLARPS